MQTEYPIVETPDDFVNSIRDNLHGRNLLLSDARLHYEISVKIEEYNFYTEQKN